jgi:hypothetical protein
MSNRFLKPGIASDGETTLLVRDPLSRIPLAAGGEWKSLSIFWSRRLRDGDVIDATPAETLPGAGGFLISPELIKAAEPAAAPQQHKPRRRTHHPATE